MKATDVLKEEHKVIERVLNTLDRAAARLEAGGQVPPELFLEAAEFAKGFADGCHHKKEEDVLFRRMIDLGYSRQEGPVAVMFAEHDQGRAYIRGLREAVYRWQSGDESARTDIIKNVRGYTALLREHILKENNILFPMAEAAIPAADYDQVWEDFEHVEHEETGEGVHEKYLALADRLEQVVA